MARERYFKVECSRCGEEFVAQEDEDYLSPMCDDCIGDCSDEEDGNDGNEDADEATGSD